MGFVAPTGCLKKLFPLCLLLISRLPLHLNLNFIVFLTAYSNVSSKMSRILFPGVKIANKFTKKFMECKIEISKSCLIHNYNNGEVLCVTHLFWHDSNERI